MSSLCEGCRHVREVVTPKGSRFLLRRLSHAGPHYPRYPAQPVLRCAGYRAKDQQQGGLRSCADEGG